MIPTRLRRLLALPLAGFAAVALLACTSSGDGGDGVLTDFLGTGAQYTSDDVPGSGTAPYVAMAQSANERTSFCVDVRVHRVMDLYSVAFTLSHDPAQAALRGYSVGGFLGNDLLASVDDSTPGNVIVGVSRQLSVHGMTGVTGEGSLIELCFDVVGEGEGRLNFIPNLALEDPTGASVPNGPPVFVGGELITGV